MIGDLGRVAYEAYYRKARGVSLISGAPLPVWNEQDESIQDCWQAAGEAIARRCVDAALEALREGVAL